MTVPEYHTRRTIIYSAQAILREQGYDVVRITERQDVIFAFFHLIAWNIHGELLFIRIGSPRMKKSSVEEELRILSELARTGRFPGEIQYWQYKNQCWNRLLILPGGSIPLTDVTHGYR